MNIMSNRALSLKEIIGIIKAGGDAGVEELRFGDLNIKYRSQIAQSNVAGQIFNQVEPEGARIAVTGGNEIPLMTEADKKDEQDEYQRAQELINDPLAHENDLIDQAIRGSA